MNIRTTVAALSLAVGSLVSVPAFAQTVPCNTGAVPIAQPVVGQTVYAQPVVGQTVYAQPPGYVPVGYAQPGYGRPAQAQNFAARREFMRFAASLRTRLAQADQQVRVGVARGAVAPQAINAFAAQRAQIEASLARASQDGFLAPQEQMRLDQMTARLERIDEQFRVPVGPVGYANRGRRWR